MKKLKECIIDEFEYPFEDIMSKGILNDHMYSYVSCSYCNGIVNWLKNIEAYMLCRYSFNGGGDCYGETYCEDPKSEENFHKYKDFFDIIERMNNASELEWRHTKFEKFETDDIIIVGETYCSYWMIWFDNDVSDCVIVKISKTHYDSLNDFNTAVEDFFKENNTLCVKIRKPDGWINF